MGHNLDFWHARWRTNQIGFHQPAPSKLLVENYDRFPPSPKGRVLVPLCGKSKDLMWLANKGHEVIGIEASELAVVQFEAEEGKQEHVEIISKDFFEVRPKQIGHFSWIFDRGALVALDEKQQVLYAQHEASFLEPLGRIFLITVEYDPTKMSGPPWSVPDASVRALYPGARLIERLADRDCLEQKFIDRGLSAMREAAYAISF